MTYFEANEKGINTPMIIVEELSELIKAISKLERGKLNYKDNLIEEMADVMLVMDWIKSRYNISSDDILPIYQKKLERQLDK